MLPPRAATRRSVPNSSTRFSQYFECDVGVELPWLFEPDIAMTPKEIEHPLSRNHFMHLATCRPSGMPHLVSRWYSQSSRTLSSLT